MTILNMVYYTAGWWGGWQPWANTLVYYNISDYDTNSTIYDRSINHNDVTWTITYWTDATAWKVFTAGRPSRSIINFGNEFTFISWAYYTATTGCIFSNWAWSSSFASNAFFAWWNSTSKIWGLAWWNTTWPDKIVLSQTNIPTNQWVMYAYTRDSSWNLKIYLNGALDNTTTIATNPTYPSWTTFMLWWWWGWWNNMSGKIKTLIWENRTRTADEITTYYNSTKSAYGL
jgi:hypothetical protein